MEIVKILLGKGGDVDQVARTSKHILMFVFAYLNSALLLFISCIAIIAYSYMPDIVLTLVLMQESYIEAPHLL